MKVEASAIDGVLVVTLGEEQIVAGNAEQFKADLARIIPAGTRKIVLDLGPVRFLDSSGVGLMVAMMKTVNRAGGSLRVAGLAPQPLALFRTVNLDRVIPISRDVEDAVSILRGEHRGNRLPLETGTDPDASDASGNIEQPQWQKRQNLGELAQEMTGRFKTILALVIGRIQYLRMVTTDEKICGSLDIMENAALQGMDAVKRVDEFVNESSSPIAGSIVLESQPGKGTPAMISPPAAQGLAGAAPPPLSEGAAAQPEIAPGRVMVVDDEPMVCDLLKDILSAMGCDVTLCAGGPDVLNLFKAGSYDLVMTDLNMPGMSGWEVAREIHARDPMVPVALFSAWGAQLDSAAIRDNGIDFVFPKPFEISTIRDVLAAAMALGGLRRSGQAASAASAPG